MSTYYEDESVTLHHGDCIEVMRTLPDNSVDSVVCDPPYGLEFMGKGWDGADGFRRSLNANDSGRDDAFGRASRTSPEYRAGALFQEWCELWTAECLRVLKPGGHLLAFGGTRTWHRLACAVEDAGFEVRDSIAWLYGSGFPKSLDVSKAIDKAAGAEREVVGRRSDPRYQHAFNGSASSPMGNVDPRRERTDHGNMTAAATPAAEQWQGWGTALKPAFEPVVVARKPLTGTVAQTVLEHGTGALNIDATRIEGVQGSGNWTGLQSAGGYNGVRGDGVRGEDRNPSGRWPTNVVLDDTQAAVLDEQSGERTSGSRKEGTYRGLGYMGSDDSDYPAIEGDTGGASRFFPTFRYEAKAPASERPKVNGTAHPTVKPLDLCCWLVRLVTPPGGTVLEPFAGSGTTVEACVIEGFKCIAIEKTDEYLPLTVARIHRRRDPVAAIKLAGDDLGLFDLGDDS